MDTRQTVVLVGETLVIDVIDACLQNMSSIATARLSSTNPDFRQQLNALSCGLIIIDLDGPELPALTTHLKNQHQAPIMLLNADTNDAVLMCSQTFKLRCVDELVDVVKAITGGQKTVI